MHKKTAVKEVFWLLLRSVLIVGCCFFVQVAIAFSFCNSPPAFHYIIRLPGILILFAKYAKRSLQNNEASHFACRLRFFFQAVLRRGAHTLG